MLTKKRLEHGELNLNVYEGVSLKNILDSLNLLERAINLFTEKCIIAMEVDVDRCRKLLVALESNSWAVSSSNTVKQLVRVKFAQLRAKLRR